MSLGPFLYALIAAAANVLGAAAVTSRARWSMRALDTMVALSAGFMIAVSLGELLPESIERGGQAAAWAALRPGGRILVLEWPLPSGPDESRTRHGELIAGVQLDEQFGGTALASRDQFRAWFETAGLPAPAPRCGDAAVAAACERPACASANAAACVRAKPARSVRACARRRSAR